MTGIKRYLPSTWPLLFLLLSVLNGLLIWHHYPLALLLLVNLVSALWLFVICYRGTIRQRQTVNLIDTLLISLRQGDYAIRANELCDENLTSTVHHLNQLASSMQRDQRLLAEQQALLNQIIETVDFALVVFNESKCVFANQYAKSTIDSIDDESIWTWYCKIKEKQQQGKVSIPLAGQSHTFLLEQSECVITGQSHQLVVLKQLDSILYQQEKEALKKFVRILSHEINNTLTPIGTVARSLKRRLVKEVDVDGFNTGLTLINERAHYLKSFMDNYVSLAKIPIANKQAEKCQQLCDEMRAMYPELNIVCDNNVVGFFDKGQIKQALCHLVNNAYEAVVDKPIVSLRISALAEKVELVVSDNGLGFTNIEDASTAFYTTKANGNGIGLMLSRIIVDNHGSTLMLENAEQSGAVVRFTVERIVSDDV